MSRLVKFIYDDRDHNSQGWFVREYKDGQGTTEYQGAQSDKDADLYTLIEDNNLSTSGTDFELYRSISDSRPAETC